MALINFLGPIELESMNLNVKDFLELKNELNKIDKLREWLPICAVAINNEIVKENANFSIKNDDVISLLPPVCGG